MSATPIPTLQEIIARNRGRKRYRLRMSDIPGRVFEGEVDFETREQHLRFSQGGLDAPIAEAIWRGEKGIGRRGASKDWFALLEPPLFDYNRLAVDLLATFEPREIDITSDQITILLAADADAILPRTAECAGAIVQRLRRLTDPDFAERLASRLGTIQPDIEITADPRTFDITSLSVSVFPDMRRPSLLVVFRPPERAIDTGRIDRIVPVDTIPLPLLTWGPHFRLGGWSENACHAAWMQRSIDRLLREDAALHGKHPQMTEIENFVVEPYSIKTAASQTPDPDPKKHHPLIVGSKFEDHATMPAGYDAVFKSDDAYAKNTEHYFSSKEYRRDSHHFGGDGTGLKYRWYFTFYDVPTPPKPNDYYYSARDWGFGGDRLLDESQNRLSFTEAIGQYNQYTVDAKARAYLMLGHVAHLLQDMGQPDHARRLDHAASSMDEAKAFARFRICETWYAIAFATAAGPCAAAGPFWPICVATIADAAFLVCKASIDEDEVGFEKLLSDKTVSGEWRLDIVEAIADKMPIPDRQHYDDFFGHLSSFADKTASDLGFIGRLGLDDIDIPFAQGSVPGLNPDIDKTDPSEYQPYLDLAYQLVPSVLCETTGFLRYFFRIVNHPPILQRVAVVQWDGGEKPAAFGELYQVPQACKRYAAEWRMKDGRRELWVDPFKPGELSPDRSAYVFLMFGPALGGDLYNGTRVDPRSRAMNMKDLKLRARGTRDGVYFDEPVALKEAEDPKLGVYYWGEFTPRNCSKDPYQITFYVNGRDLGEHFDGRLHSGEELDSNPATLATVSPAYPHEWKNYSSGYGDIYHRIMVREAKWRLTCRPGEVVLGVLTDQEARIEVQLEQLSWDCGMEPSLWAPSICPVAWRLSPKAVQLSPAILSARPEDFGFRLVEKPLRGGRLEIGATCDWDTVQPGTYLFSVFAEVGDPPNHTLLKGSFRIEII